MSRAIYFLLKKIPFFSIFLVFKLKIDQNFGFSVIKWIELGMSSSNDLIEFFW